MSDVFDVFVSYLAAVAPSLQTLATYVEKHGSISVTFHQVTSLSSGEPGVHL